MFAKIAKIAAATGALGIMFSKLVTHVQKMRWIAGFLGGDGCIHVSDRGVRVTYVQAKKGIANIKYIQDIEGGTITKLKRDNRSPNRQDAYALTLCGTDALDHLDRLEPHIVSKKLQCESALSFPRVDLRTVAIANRPDIVAERISIKDDCSRLKHIDEDIDPQRMSLELIGGWMAAEGCVHISAQGYASLSITQKQPNVLIAIRDFFECGNVSGYKWTVTKRDDVEIIARKLMGLSGAKDTALAILIEYLAMNSHHEIHGLGSMLPRDIDSRRRAISNLNGGSIQIRDIDIKPPTPKRVMPIVVNSEITGYSYKDINGIERCFSVTRHRTLEDAKDLALGARDAVTRAKARRRRTTIEGVLSNENNLA